MDENMLADMTAETKADEIVPFSCDMTVESRERPRAESGGRSGAVGVAQENAASSSTIVRYFALTASFHNLTKQLGPARTRLLSENTKKTARPTACILHARPP